VLLCPSLSVGPVLSNLVSLLKLYRMQADYLCGM
jgi:hypothetical protein